MSPDRTTITRAEAIRQRKEQEQNRREKRAPRIISGIKPAAAAKPAQPKARHSVPARSVSPSTPGQLRRRYELAMSGAYTRNAAFGGSDAKRLSFSFPRLSFGPRWFSFVIIAFCIVDMYLLFNIDPFIVRHATILGNQRLTAPELEQVMGAANQPALLLNPAQIEYNILATYPEIASVQVQVNLPGDLVVSIQERTPVAAWKQDGQTVWVDAQGYAFPVRGTIANLVTINAAGAPPAMAASATQTVGAKPFISSDLANEIENLSPYLPQGASLVFDPQYGIGWSDPKGWNVYFGHSNGDTPLKLKVYQSILDSLAAQNIQPTMISVEFPGAPYYRAEKLEQ